MLSVYVAYSASFMCYNACRLCSLWVPGKVHFPRLFKTAQTVDKPYGNRRFEIAQTVILVVSVTNSARLRFVRCVHGIVGAQWVTGKFAFLRIARNTLHRRFHNALGVCSIFCKVQVCKMHCDFAHSGSQEKSILNSCSRQLKL